MTPKRPKLPPQVESKANDPKGERAPTLAPPSTPPNLRWLDELLVLLRAHDVASCKLEESGRTVTLNLFQRSAAPVSETEEANAEQSREERQQAFERRMRLGATARFG